MTTYIRVLADRGLLVSIYCNTTICIYLIHGPRLEEFLSQTFIHTHTHILCIHEKIQNKQKHSCGHTQESIVLFYICIHVGIVGRSRRRVALYVYIRIYILYLGIRSSDRVALPH